MSGARPLSRTAVRRRSAPSRRAMTLLEVLLALGIFLISMTAIQTLISFGTRAFTEAQLESEATLRAETALNEVLAGVQPLQTTAGTPFEDDPNWQWSLQVLDGPHTDLVLLEVSAFRQEPGQEQPQGTITLRRLTRDPQLFIDAALASE